MLSYPRPEDDILILGPGLEKSQACHRIEQHGNRKGKVVGLQHASRLAEVELVFPTVKV